MNNIKINTTSSNTLLAIPLMFSTMLTPNYEIGLLQDSQLYNKYNPTDVFKKLNPQDVTLEQEQMNIFFSFISKVLNESTDLDGEIVDMVNRKFEKLLLKL
jgi:transcription termination factor NusB